MILVLDVPAHSLVEHLLARSAKDGKPEVRGPLATAAQRLNTLNKDAKLHIVAANTRAASELADLLSGMGLPRNSPIRQIHLLIDDSGLGDPDSFASQLCAGLAARGHLVQEIKAPRGRVRWDAAGKVFVLPPGSAEWQPSRPELNTYAGAAVSAKHLNPGAPRQ